MYTDIKIGNEANDEQLCPNCKNNHSQKQYIDTHIFIIKLLGLMYPFPTLARETDSLYDKTKGTVAAPAKYARVKLGFKIADII